MEKQEVIGRLPWLLNDSLGSEERSIVVAQLHEHADLRRELAETVDAFALFGQHPSAEALVDWVFDEATDDRLWMDEHVASCRACADHAGLVQASRCFEDEGLLPFRPSRQGTTSPSSTPSRSHQTTMTVPLAPTKRTVAAYWQAAAVAASVAAVLCLSGWLGLFGAPAPITATLPLSDTAGVATSALTGLSVLATQPLVSSNLILRGALSERQIVLQPGFDIVVLELNESDLARELSWTYVLENEAGERVHSRSVGTPPASNGKRVSHLPVAIPLSVLSPGLYEVVLYPGTDTRKATSRFQFRAIAPEE